MEPQDQQGTFLRHVTTGTIGRVVDVEKVQVKGMFPGSKEGETTLRVNCAWVFLVEIVEGENLGRLDTWGHADVCQVRPAEAP